AGIFYLAKTEEKLAGYQHWLGQARSWQLDTRTVRGDVIAEHLGAPTGDFAGALYTPSDGRAEPSLATRAMAEAAELRGAVILARTAVRTLERAAGRVSGVVTEHGRIECDAVVVAAGVWSRLFLGNCGVVIPQLRVISSALRTAPFDGPAAAASGPGFAFRKRLDGGYTVAQGTTTVSDIVPDSFRFFFLYQKALKLEWKTLKLRFGRAFLDAWMERRRWKADQRTPFEAIRTLNPAPVAPLLREAVANTASVFPVFRGVAVAETWAGAIDVMPDAIPVLSDVPAIPGLHIATGLSGHGFGIGPGVGRLMADLVTGAPPVVDPTPFRFSRFTDGEVIAPYTGGTL
ncbi:MAG: FAD-binding oxidoreductase, partial [Pseudomonadota bacterium]